MKSFLLLLLLSTGAVFGQLGTATGGILRQTRTNIVAISNFQANASIILSDGYRITTQADLGSGGGGGTGVFNFATSQFTTSGSNVTIKAGAGLTNAAFAGSNWTSANIFKLTSASGFEFTDGGGGSVFRVDSRIVPRQGIGFLSSGNIDAVSTLRFRPNDLSAEPTNTWRVWIGAGGATNMVSIDAGGITFPYGGTLGAGRLWTDQDGTGRGGWAGHDVDLAGYSLRDVSGVYRVGTFNLGADVGIAYFTNSFSLGYGAAGSEVEYLAITSSGLKILPTGSPGSGKFLTADADGYVSWATPSGGGSQTPWSSTINGAGYPLTNVGSLSVTGPITSASLNITTLSQGFTSLTVAAVTAVTVDMGSKLEIWATNNLAFTNWTGIAGTNANDAVVFIYPKTNITVTWPAFKTGTLGAYFGTNANAPMLTTLTNGDWYILSASAIRTNVAVTLTRF